MTKEAPHVGDRNVIKLVIKGNLSTRLVCNELVYVTLQQIRSSPHVRNVYIWYVRDRRGVVWVASIWTNNDNIVASPRI